MESLSTEVLVIGAGQPASELPCCIQRGAKVVLVSKGPLRNLAPLFAHHPRLGIQGLVGKKREASHLEKFMKILSG